MSFIKRLALFVFILAVMILLFGLFPVIAQGVLPDYQSDSINSEIPQPDEVIKNLNFIALLP
ncbi:MAG TPA: hypothetical protein DEO84_01470 [candidate division Zixibacteria bacterium]|nr:hypothetical protein [candidate division Zixibacteria bacterium]HBY99965.1 hypothetical protein [candidate division Zixibacteria bacterium]